MTVAARPLTGRRVALIAGVIFAIVLTPNIVLSVMAVRTFSGLVVPNSYVASQEFDRNRRAQQALGWTLALTAADGRVALAFTDANGRAVHPDALAVTIGRPSTSQTDQILNLAREGSVYVADVALAPGNWLVQVRATAADGTAYARDEPIYWAPAS